ncbi:hypothetical protein HDU76_009521, partial [Blyttiomyces sp. JEL0837]
MILSWLYKLVFGTTDQVVLAKEEDLVHATSYIEWKGLAEELDELKGIHECFQSKPNLVSESFDHLGNDIWKMNPASDIYDCRLIQHRLNALREARLLRNLGGLNDPKLFTHAYIGTKNLIQDYQEEVVRLLNLICDTDSTELTPSSKLEFFNDTKQSFGCSALVLQGGATFGLCHLGVVKALNEHGLLPRIISGSSVGALIASLVCIHTDDELPNIFEEGGIDLKAFSRKGTKGNIRRKITRFLKHGYLMDVKVLEDCVRSNVGDITFEEAFLRTRRILNITVSTARKNEVPRLLNYLTAPNVLIWSAACASAAVIGLYESVDLLAKDKSGNIVHWSPSTVKWADSSYDSESPESRLAELFDVNHFIVSQANPYIAPFLSKGPQESKDGLIGKTLGFVSSEIRHRLHQ